MMEAIKSFIKNQGKNELPTFEVKWRNLKYINLENTINQMYNLKN